MVHQFCFFYGSILTCFFFIEIPTHVQNLSMSIPKKIQILKFCLLFSDFTIHEDASEVAGRNLMSLVFLLLMA